ncbi:hypothetical protein ACA910_007372 [Epithemia clementina (nom. ined.)]
MEVDVLEEIPPSVAVNNGGHRTAPTNTESGSGCVGVGAITQNNNSNLPPPVLAVGCCGAESLAGVPVVILTIPTNGFGGGAGCTGAAGTTQNNNSHLPPLVLAVGNHGVESLAGVPGGIHMIPMNGFGGSGSSSSSFYLHHGAYSHVYGSPSYFPPPPHHGMALYHHPTPYYNHHLPHLHVQPPQQPMFHEAQPPPQPMTASVPFGAHAHPWMMPQGMNGASGGPPPLPNATTTTSRPIGNTTTT